jgi:hypothetical protein
MGFGWSDTDRAFVVDPSDAVSETLDAIFEGRDELPVESFVERLSEELPVLDNGYYWNTLAKRVSEADLSVPEGHEMSTALSRALLRLRIQGEIVFEERDDAEERVLLGRGQEPIEGITHIRLEKVEN